MRMKNQVFQFRISQKEPRRISLQTDTHKHTHSFSLPLSNGCDVSVNCLIQPLNILPITTTTTKGENNEPQWERGAHQRGDRAQHANEISICRFCYGRMWLVQGRVGASLTQSLLSASSLQFGVKDTLKGGRRALIRSLWLQNAIRGWPCLCGWLSRGLLNSHMSRFGQAGRHNYFLISPL